MRGRIGEGGREMKKRKKHRRTMGLMWEKGYTWAQGEKNVDERVLVQ